MDYISYLRSCISPLYIFVSLEFMFFSASLDRFISVQLKNKNTVKSENYLVIYSQIVHLLQFSQQRPLKTSIVFLERGSQNVKINLVLFAI